MMHSVCVWAFVLFSHFHDGIYSCVCGIGNEPEIDLRIINGDLAYPHQYPWMANIKFKGKVNCGGAIINNYYILTAGHCIYHGPLDDITVVLGGYDDEANDGIVFESDEFIVHPNFTRLEEYDTNDIALIKLKKPINFNRNVSPICLPKAQSTYSGVHAVVAGWGITEYKQPSKYLLQTMLTIRRQDECLRSNIAQDFVPEDNLCAYGFNTDSCTGDSGAPLMYEYKPFKFEVAGVTSWGNGCSPNRTPSVYMKVTNYLPWITANTEDAIYCQHR